MIWYFYIVQNDHDKSSHHEIILKGKKITWRRGRGIRRIYGCVYKYVRVFGYLCMCVYLCICVYVCVLCVHVNFKEVAQERLAQNWTLSTGLREESE